MTKVFVDNDEEVRHNGGMKKVAAALLLWTAGTAGAQGPAVPAAQASEAFDVISVRPYVYGVRGRADVRCENGHFLFFGFGMDAAIQFAYDLKSYQQPKLPSWTESREGYYDIEARAAAPVSEKECKLMVRALLADRFKMRAHWETKVASVYELVVAKNGPKVPRAADTDQSRGVFISLNGNMMQSLAPTPPRGYTMEQLTSFLNMSGRPVIDRTGLEGLYKITLSFGVTPRGADSPSEYPDIVTAVQEQLGLKLQDAKDPIDVLIIDHMEKPDAN